MKTTQTSGAGIQTLDKLEIHYTEKPQIRREDTFTASGRSLGEFQVRSHNPRFYAEAEGKPFYQHGGTIHHTETGNPVRYQGIWKIESLTHHDLTDGGKLPLPTTRGSEEPRPEPKEWYLCPWEDEPDLVPDTELWKHHFQSPVFSWENYEEAKTFADEFKKNFENEKFREGYLQYTGFSVQPNQDDHPDTIRGFKAALEHEKL